MSDTRSLRALTPRSRSLDNGLVMTAVELPALHRSVIAVQVRVGSVYEATFNNGSSHFLEHVLFRGTPQHPTAYQLASSFEALGGTLEAGTAEDHGILSISVPPESLLPTLETFCSVLTEPLLRDLDVERNIVREEILEGLDEEGRDISASSRARQLCFGAHPLGFPIVGTLDALDRFDEQLLRSHHSQHYTGCNMALAVAGPVDALRVLGDAEKRLSHVPRGKAPASREVPEQREARFEFFRHQASQTSLSVCFRACGRDSPVEPATDMLLRIIDDGMSTRLYHRICDELGLCYDAGAGYQAFDSIGVVEFGADTTHAQADVVLQEIFTMTRDLAAHGPNQDELDRARKRCRWQFNAMLDEPEAIAHFFAQAALETSAPTPEQRCEQLCDVSREGLLAAAQAIFRRENLSVAAVGLQRSKQQARLEQLVCSG
jgi:predicted Zn-dependent peptidase